MKFANLTVADGRLHSPETPRHHVRGLPHDAGVQPELRQAAWHLNAAFVDSMAAIKPLLALDMLDNLKKELPLYKVA